MELLFNIWSTNYVLAGILSIVAGYCIIRRWKFYYDSPPGPWGLPFVGYYPFLSKAPHREITQLAKKYGDIFSLNIGQRYVVILNSFDVIRDAYVKQGDIFSGKVNDDLNAFFFEYRSLFVTDGEIWRRQHRFLLSALRDFGFGKKSLEDSIRDEAQEAVQILRKENGQPYELIHLTIKMASNAIAYLIFGERFQYDDPEFKIIIDMFAPIDGLEFFNLIDSFPIIMSLPLPPKLTGFEFMIKATNKFKDFVDKMHDKQKITFDENNLRSIIDVYLMKIKQQNEQKPTDESNIFTHEHMRANVLLFFGAGVDTTSTTVANMMKILAAHPEVQKKMQMEIDDVIGRDRSPTLNDRLQMPYTEAALTELHRYVALIPLNFFHRVTADTRFHGYHLPKNTLVVANFWNVHRDPQTWKDPMKFDPDRFLLDPKLKERVIPFSLGKRACIGESLARTEIFLYVITFLQHFTFKPPEGEKFNIDPVKFLPGSRLDNYKICAIPRN